MSSRLQRKQARRNGALATGTKSPETTQKPSLNALTHGLTAKFLVLSNESQAAYDKLRLEYVTRFQPQDGVEMDLIDDMVSARWRLRRIASMQTAALDLQMDKDEKEVSQKFQQIDQPTRLLVAFDHLSNDGNTMQLLMRYETTYSRMYDRAMKALQQLRQQDLQPEGTATSEELRNETRPEQPAPAAPLDSIAEPQKLAEMVTKMSPEELIGYLNDLKQQCEGQQPPPESTE